MLTTLTRLQSRGLIEWGFVDSIFMRWGWFLKLHRHVLMLSILHLIVCLPQKQLNKTSGDLGRQCCATKFVLKNGPNACTSKHAMLRFCMRTVWENKSLGGRRAIHSGKCKRTFVCWSVPMGFIAWYESTFFATPPLQLPEYSTSNCRVYASFCMKDQLTQNTFECCNPLDCTWSYVTLIPGIGVIHMLKGFAMVSIGYPIYIISCKERAHQSVEFVEVCTSSVIGAALQNLYSKNGPNVHH